MTPEMWIGVAGFIVLLVLIFMRVWVGFSLIIVGFVGIWILKGFGFAGSFVGSEPFTQATAYAMTCMPLFTMMGAIISETGMGAKLYRWARTLIGHVRGGLGIATVVSCGIFAAICGNSQVTAMTIGKIAYPEMRKYGYKETIAAGGIAAGGGIGIMIPPSLGFMVFGLLTELSIGKLFMCGLIPGILLTVLYSLVYVVVGFVKPEMVPTSDKAPWKEVLTATKEVWPVIILMVIMLGGIYLGFFTATEAGAVGAVGSIIVALLARCLTKKNLYNALLQGTRMTATVMILLIGAKVFLRFITLTNLTNFVSAWMIGLGVSRGVIILIIIVLYFILGSVFDIMSAILLTVPFLYPIIVSLGLDPYWFGVFVVAMMEMGEISPPIGITCFVLSETLHLPTGKVFKGVFPFMAAMIVFIAVICIFPNITLLLM